MELAITKSDVDHPLPLTYDCLSADTESGLPLSKSGAAISVVVASLIVNAPLAAQSLADVARKEEERRKEVKQPAKVITNKDLAAAPASSTPPPAAAPGKTDTTASPDATDKDKATRDKDKEAKDQDKDAGAKEPAKDQKYWAGRLKALREQHDRDQTYADALQSRINALTTDFVNRADPAQRAVIERDRQKAIDELNHLKDQIKADKKALADFDEEARRAGVPPGWLR
jgi:hypothetical protein